MCEGGPQNDPHLMGIPERESNTVRKEGEDVKKTMVTLQVSFPGKKVRYRGGLARADT